MSIPSGSKCSVVFCSGVVVGQNLCAKHYKQMQRHGAPSKEVSAKLIDGKKLSAHPLYQTWRSITRIARGTQICEEWRDFEQFVRDVGSKPVDAVSIRRLDSKAKFSKDNAAWHTSVTSADSKSAACKSMKSFYEANPDYARWASIKSKYGVTKAQYTELLDAQNGVCKICKQPESRTTKTGQAMNLHIDHCHGSKAIRGLLCHTCNTALGLFKDSPELLQAAIEYLRENK